MTLIKSFAPKYTLQHCLDSFRFTFPCIILTQAAILWQKNRKRRSRKVITSVWYSIWFTKNGATLLSGIVSGTGWKSSSVVYDVMARPKEHPPTPPRSVQVRSFSSIYRCHGNFVREEFVRHLEETIHTDTLTHTFTQEKIVAGFTSHFDLKKSNELFHLYCSEQKIQLNGKFNTQVNHKTFQQKI